MATDDGQPEEQGKQTNRSRDPDVADFERKVEHWKNESQDNRRRYDQRWAKNIQLLRGIYPPNELNRSKVRKRSKIFFRKIWSTDQRIVAAMYYAFLREQDRFRIEARTGDPEEDLKATALQELVTYRVDQMMRAQQLFIKFIWGIMNMLDLGWTCGLLHWKYDEEYDTDEPDFTLFPNEQVFPDLAADTKEKMRYIIFESYVTMEDIEEKKLKLPDGINPGAIPYNIVRAARYINQNDPMQYQDSPQANAYPQAGMGRDVQKEERGTRYRLEQVFFRESGKIMYSVLINGMVAKAPAPSKYGNKYNMVVMGTVLTVAHKLLGEGFPEAMEGPQESINTTLNQRKDNVSLLMNGEYVVSRFSNVDLQALGVSRPGNIVLADDPEAVAPMKKADYTQSAYMEAAQDEGMMGDVSGVGDSQLGNMSGGTKAATAQINQANGSAKIDLFIAMAGETFFRDFYTQLTMQVQRFETNEKAFKIANFKLRQKFGPLVPHVDDVDDFEAELDLKVGPTAVNAQVEKQELMMAMDRAIMSNQAAAALLSSGMTAPDGITIFNPSEFMKILLPKWGQKNLEKFFIKVQPPPPQAAPGTVGPGGQAAAGANAAQPMSMAGMARPQPPTPIQAHVPGGTPIGPR